MGITLYREDITRVLMLAQPELDAGAAVEDAFGRALNRYLSVLAALRPGRSVKLSSPEGPITITWDAKGDAEMMRVER